MRTSGGKRPTRAGLVALLASAVLFGGGPGSLAGPEPAIARPAAKPRVTFVGDSISASLDYVAAARSVLSRAYRMRYDLEVCRRLVTKGCKFQGRVPSNTLQAVKSAGGSLGEVLIVHVGYNEGSPGYAAGMQQVIQTALGQGASGVVWVTLRETRALYRDTNAAIRKEARRWSRVRVADWESLSRGRPWFREDGLHLNSAGAMALAELLRASVARLT